MSVHQLVSSDLRANWRKFAEQLFKLEDADPGYMLLRRAELNGDQKRRYVVAWCAYYNPGIAAIASNFQGSKFWDYLDSIYATAKRASERRHFRGKSGLKALADWRRDYPKPEQMIVNCMDTTYLGVRRKMRGITQMGDYFYWKMADIIDTVFGQDVDFTGCEQYMPKVPKQGADIIAGMEFSWPDASLEATMSVITRHIKKWRHPFNDRPLALQEAETVCCVFKQHVVGDYRLGFRSAKAEARLLSVKDEAPATVKALLNGLYDGGIWTPSALATVKEMM